MKISIVVCTRNRAAALSVALKHYGKWRDRFDWELLLVDNASTDDTQAVIKFAQVDTPQLKMVYEGRVGLGAARELGWRSASGEIVVFTDDDCYPDENLLDAYKELFIKNSDLYFAGGRILLWDESDIKVTVDYRDTFSSLRPYKYVAAGALQGANLAFRKTTLAEIGGVDINLGAGTPFPCEDIDMVARASFLGMAGCFDPRPIIFHHHGRKEIDRSNVLRNYDYGRGAYFAKFILRKDTRSAYLKEWYYLLLKSGRSCLLAKSLQPLLPRFRELKSGFEYLYLKCVRNE